jgi:ankyrin repeat protein
MSRGSRLICIDSFNTEITSVICNKKILETSPPGRHGMPNALHTFPQTTEYVVRRAMAEPWLGIQNLPAAIHSAVYTLITTHYDSDEGPRDNFTRRLCTAAINFRKKDAVQMLKSEFEHQNSASRKPLKGSITNNVFTAAAYLGCESFFQVSQLETLVYDEENLYFGFLLVCAAREGHYNIFKLLLDHGSTSGQHSYVERLALKSAARGGHADIVRMYWQPEYKHHISCNTAYEDAIACAAQGNHLHIINLIWENVTLERPQKVHNRVLTSAAHCGHLELVRLALYHGADPNCWEGRVERKAPLSLAASRGHLEIVGLLLERGANQKHRGKSDYAISLAFENGWHEVFKILLHHKDGIGDSLKGSVLCSAVSEGQFETVELILKSGIDFTEYYGFRAAQQGVWRAARVGNERILRHLVACGADPNSCAQIFSTYCTSALQEALKNGHRNVARALIELGAETTYTGERHTCRRLKRWEFVYESFE